MHLRRHLEKMIASRTKEKLYNGLYICHATVVWAGSITQIYHIYAHKSAQDVTLFWIACILLAEFLALPRALKSPFWVWKMCHLVAIVLITILLTGVVLYG